MSLKHPQIVARRSGYTLVEVLVAIAIISVLLGLMFVGVQAARESARLASCQSNLRQIGLALLNYESASRVLPYGHSRQGFSMHVTILPFIGEQARYDQFDVTRPETDSPENETLQRQSPLTYSCPSSNHRGGMVISYYSNAGTGMYDGTNGALISWHDQATNPNRLVGQISTAAIADGASNTAMVSEVLFSDPDLANSYVLRYQPREGYDRETYARFARKCFSRSGFASTQPYGATWIRGDPGNSRYFHVLTPNQPHCSNDGATQQNIVNASSNHPHGAEVLLCDGSVHWTSDSIELSIWRAMGSRDGSESELSLH